jgi:hypothetical protein
MHCVLTTRSIWDRETATRFLRPFSSTVRTLMKKHILIGIPSILLLMFSFGSLSIGLDAFYRYSFISEQIDVLKPKHQDKAIAVIKSTETLEDAKKYGLSIISSNHNELELIHEFLGSVIYGAKESFFLFAIFSGISAFLAVVLVAGLAPMFGKGSNKSLKEGTPESGAP